VRARVFVLHFYLIKFDCSIVIVVVVVVVVSGE
jgi:hypothetical protein